MTPISRKRRYHSFGFVMFKPLLILSMLVFFSLPAHADEFADGEAAYRLGDYPTALKLLQPLAEQGNSEAQDSLGHMYFMGSGVQQDYAEAMNWFRKAAEQGNADAQCVLGYMYWNGRGIPNDNLKATKWYRKAAENGDVEAQDDLSKPYWHLEVGKEESEKWFRSALRGYEKKAEQGDWFGIARLCEMYGEEKRPLPPDYEKTYFWCSLTPPKTHDGQYRIRSSNEARANWAGKHLTPKQVAAAKKRVDEWTQTHPAPAAHPTGK